MIDFCKLRLSCDANSFLVNKLLTFNGQYNCDTGEILNYPLKSDWFRNFKFIITENNIFGNGTFHKYWQNGNNFLDFSHSDLVDAVEEYCNLFNVDKSKTKVHRLEFGVNITPPFNPTLKNIKRCFISYKGKGFQPLKSTSGKNIGVESNFEQFRIKIYSKTLQYNLRQWVLRFEIQIKKMQALNQYQYIMLSDLVQNKDLIEYLKHRLNQTIKDIIVYDHTIKPKTSSESTFILKASNPIYWEGISKSKRYKSKIRLEKITKKHGGNLHQNLINLITEKGDLLTNFKNSKR